MRFSIRIKEPMNKAAYGVYIFLNSSDGPLEKTLLLKPTLLTFEELGVDGQPVYFGDKEPSLEITCEQFRAGFVSALLEALEKAGLKPEQASLEGELKAKKEHIEDLRKISFGLVNKTS